MSDPDANNQFEYPQANGDPTNTKPAENQPSGMNSPRLSLNGWETKSTDFPYPLRSDMGGNDSILEYPSSPPLLYMDRQNSHKMEEGGYGQVVLHPMNRQILEARKREGEEGGEMKDELIKKEEGGEGKVVDKEEKKE